MTEVDQLVAAAWRAGRDAALICAQSYAIELGFDALNHQAELDQVGRTNAMDVMQRRGAVCVTIDRIAALTPPGGK